MDNSNASNALTILKNAFLIERRGKALYQTAMDKAENEDVKAFFKELVTDEQEHMNILEKQFKSYMKNGAFTPGGYENHDRTVNAPDILDDTLKDKIHAASFEATAINAAIGFEQKAVKLYSARAKEATDPVEKRIYDWLATWETTHLKKLIALEESLIENIWDDNNFWPF